MTWYTLIMGIIFGGILGSYLTMVAYRLPRRIDIVRGGSRCSVCGRGLGLAENIPVIGYLLARGRCRSCGVSIPVRYILIELITIIVFTGISAINTWLGLGVFIAAVLLPAIIQWTILPASQSADAVGRDDVRHDARDDA